MMILKMRKEEKTQNNWWSEFGYDGGIEAEPEIADGS